MAAAGIAQRALDMAVEYAGGRSQFGKAIAGHQLIQERLVDIEEAILTSRLLSLHGAGRNRCRRTSKQAIGHGQTVRHTSVRKAISSTMHVFGAMGISRELGLELRKLS